MLPHTELGRNLVGTHKFGVFCPLFLIINTTKAGCWIDFCVGKIISVFVVVLEQRRIWRERSNAVQSEVVTPFSPELLTATVTFVLRAVRPTSLTLSARAPRDLVSHTIHRPTLNTFIHYEDKKSSMLKEHESLHKISFFKLEQA